MLVHQLLIRSASRHPSRPAVIHGAECFTYAQLGEAANAFAWHLLSQGLSPGDRVVTLFEKSPANVAAVFGVWQAGGVLVNLNHRLPAGMIRRIMEDCQAGFLVADVPSLGALFQDDNPPPPSLRSLLVADGPGGDGRIPGAVAAERLDWRRARPAVPPPSRISIDLSTIIYTSGSTGRQKGVMLSHLSLVDHVASVTAYLKNVPEDRLISVLPLYFGYGLSQLLTAVGVGASLSLVSSFTFPNEVVDVLERDRITGLAGVPSHFRMLLNYSDLRRRDLSSLRYFTLSGARSPVSLVRQLRRTFPEVAIYLMFGQTESTIRISYLDPAEVDARPSSIGKPMPNVQVYVLGDDGREVGVGEVGELVCRGTNVMMGYWGDPELTVSALRDHPFPEIGPASEKVLYTGDLVRRDAQGFLYFVGRKDEMIKSGAHRIFPSEVEFALQEIEGVGEVAVVAERDETLGEVVVAYVVTRPQVNSDPRAFLQQCRQRLPAYMVPRRVYFRDALPKTATGKILKAQITGQDPRAPAVSP